MNDNDLTRELDSLTPGERQVLLAFLDADPSVLEEGQNLTSRQDATQGDEGP